MTLVFIHFGSYAQFPAVLACAKARAGCPIWVISDGRNPGAVNHRSISTFPDAMRVRRLMEPNCGTWASYSLSRWFVLRDFAAKNPGALPIFCADWDVMVFRNLSEAYEPFECFDHTVSIDGKMESAAYGINRIEPLQAFCEMVEKLNLDNDPRAKNLNDMEAWSLLRRQGCWKVGDLFEIRNGSVFDHNIVCGSDRFKMDGDCKMVKFGNYAPYFVLKDGTWIPANTIHCWGPYKQKPTELLKHSGISL